MGKLRYLPTNGKLNVSEILNRESGPCHALNPPNGPFDAQNDPSIHKVTFKESLSDSPDDPGGPPDGKSGLTDGSTGTPNGLSGPPDGPISAPNGPSGLTDD